METPQTAAFTLSRTHVLGAARPFAWSMPTGRRCSDRFPAKRDAIARAATLLARGAILAVKGLGGWHLACDATRPDSVRELRRRKRRDEKPFALMVRDLETAGRLCEIEEAARALLASPAHPIVLLPLRDGAGVAAAAIAPDSKRLGLMLPYTPLHHVLMADIGRPLVMTSGNASDEPIACDDDDAFARLAPIADAFLVHDRVIASRADDSVALVALGRPVVTAPLARLRAGSHLARRVPLARPTLACGAQLKNTFCLGDRRRRVLRTAHRRPRQPCRLRGLRARHRATWSASCACRPELIAHDLHPDYLSTRYALARSARDGSSRASPCSTTTRTSSARSSSMVSRGPSLAWPSTARAIGTDGTSWGGEFLVADAAGFERVASLRCLRLAGGDRAIQHVWRMALALLDDAFEGDPPIDRLALFDGVAPERDRGRAPACSPPVVNAPLASGAGRYFDAFGALGLARPRASFEGQVAMAWEQAAGRGRDASLPVRRRHRATRLAYRSAADGARRRRRLLARPPVSTRRRALPRDAHRRRRRTSCEGMAGARGAMPVVLHGRLLPERPPRRRSRTRARAQTSPCTCTRQSRPATAASRWASSRSQTRFAQYAQAARR